jgi:eukaryotic-like serine/threonine-protein kinase
MLESDPAYELTARGKTLLQERLATFGKVVTPVPVAYFPAFYFTWRGTPGVTEEAILAHIFAPTTFVLLCVHASLWLLASLRPLPRWLLPSADVLHCAAVGVAFSFIFLTHPSPALVPLEGLLAIGSVLGMRALVVPSSWSRTALAGGLLCLSPAFTVFSRASHFSTSFFGVSTSGPLFITWAFIAIALTSVASWVLYGLRREVQHALRLGQYTLVERLGAGGMGVVYRAQHTLLRRHTAVKLLPRTTRSETLTRFEREVQLMAELTHPNTVAIYDYGRTAQGVFYYAMEYLDGIDLEGLVEVAGPQPPGRVIHLIRQVCGSLEEAHGRGLIHRDVKPANLFLCRGRSEPDTIKVLDFGLVKDLATDDPSLSTVNAVLGTPLYMAPEAFIQPGSVDARSDLYSLGAVAYLLLTGSRVFSGGTTAEVAAKHIHAQPETMGDRLGNPVPAELEAIVMSCLAKSPAARPQSARVLRDALAACASAGSWSHEDAVRWWSAHGERIAARRSRANTGTTGPQTVVVAARAAGLDGAAQ